MCKTQLYTRFEKVRRHARNKQIVNYHKYYFDSREIVSKGLNIKLTLLEPKFLRENYDDDALMDGLSGPIWPDKI